MKRLIFFIVLFYVIVQNVSACTLAISDNRIDYTEEDRQIFDRYIYTMEGKKHLAYEEVIIETAKFLIGTPYVAATLEKEPEQLVINLRELDCTTLVENVIALALTIKATNPSFETFCANLQQLRYRSTEINDYTDRLHYFSDWIVENERKNLVKDVTKAIGGQPYRLSLSFMSTHPDSYRQLKSTPDFIRKIAQKEKEISARNTYATIPEAQIENCRNGMKNGDIVCFVTRIEGLDVSHIGFIYWQNRKLGFIHASSTAKQVIIDPKSLSEYVNGISTTTGVMIVRPVL
jgi:cell wall-associated NlpC family hydrolase